MYVPTLAGVHHVKLPVRDLVQFRQWYQSLFGYQVQMEFVEEGVLRGLALQHPAGGQQLALRLDPQRAEAAAGFDYFAIGVPDEASIRSLAGHLTALGEQHVGVHWATIGWILPMLHDPDGHEVRFSTQQHPPRRCWAPSCTTCARRPKPASENDRTTDRAWRTESREARTPVRRQP